MPQNEPSRAFGYGVAFGVAISVIGTLLGLTAIGYF